MNPNKRFWPKRQMIVAVKPLPAAIGALLGRSFKLPVGAHPLRGPDGVVQAVVFFD